MISWGHDFHQQPADHSWARRSVCLPVRQNCLALNPVHEEQKQMDQVSQTPSHNDPSTRAGFIAQANESSHAALKSKPRVQRKIEMKTLLFSGGTTFRNWWISTIHMVGNNASSLMTSSIYWFMLTSSGMHIPLSNYSRKLDQRSQKKESSGLWWSSRGATPALARASPPLWDKAPYRIHVTHCSLFG